MNRRSVLKLGGVGLAGLAGCTASPQRGTPVVESTPTAEPTSTRTPIAGPSHDDDLPSDENPNDGYPPQFGETPPERDIDTPSFDSIRRDGVDVPLAPIDVTFYWYARGEARFADARSYGAFERSHVFGAVSSPEPDGGDDDPVDDWPVEDRIVCYCGCPYHLSSIRAANLLENGYEEVYVIDDGFWEWTDREYPIAGADVESRPSLRVIEGVANADFAGETAWARHHPSEQREATAIGDDGSYRLDLRFADVTPDSRIAVETPGYSVTAPLSELTEGIVDGEN